MKKSVMLEDEKGNRQTICGRPANNDRVIGRMAFLKKEEKEEEREEEKERGARGGKGEKAAFMRYRPSLA